MSSTVEITSRESEGCLVLDIQAENFTYPQSGILKNHIAHLIEQGGRFFILNFNNVGLIDSYGLASIISAHKTAKENGGSIALYGLNDTFQRLVELTHLHRVLEIWPTEAQAIYYLSTEYGPFPPIKHSAQSC